MSSSETPQNTIAVLLMAYGSPESVDEMEPYLLDIRGGRPTSPELVEEIKQRYRAIGGRSPLQDVTEEVADALEAELNERYAGLPLKFKTYIGMRHWQPRIKDAVREIRAAGIREVIALVLAPHSSHMSTGAYFERLNEAIQELGAALEVTHIENWHDHPGLIASIAEKVETALAAFEGQEPYVIFTAHSLPARILEHGDPYAEQLEETVHLLVDRLHLRDGRWQFSYQSAGQSADTWLGPSIEEVVTEKARNGEENLLVVPIGFVSDHVEVLYDIDVACRKLASQYGARLERSESLNASPTFIHALADLVEAHLSVGS